MLLLSSSSGHPLTRSGAAVCAGPPDSSPDRRSMVAALVQSALAAACLSPLPVEAASLADQEMFEAAVVAYNALLAKLDAADPFEPEPKPELDLEVV